MGCGTGGKYTENKRRGDGGGSGDGFLGDIKCLSSLSSRDGLRSLHRARAHIQETL